MSALLRAVFSCAAALLGCGDAHSPPLAQNAARADASLWIEPVSSDRSIVVHARLPTRSAASLPERAVTEKAGRAWLTLRLADVGDGGPPIVGRYTRDGTLLRFAPALPLRAGTGYVATLTVPGAAAVTLQYSPAPAPASAATTVRTVEPVLAEIPANLLRFYVTFSAPMQGGDGFFEHVHLVDAATGEQVEMPWREIELWSADRTRVTLLVHPGRVKSGISFAEQLGPVLHAGHRYDLVLDAALPDADGRPLGEERRTRFSVLAPDTTLPVVEQWRIGTPAARTRDPLTLEFDEAMDAELLRTRISLRVGDHALAGTPEVAAGGTQWRFVPAHAWVAGAHHLVLSGELEDLAGNTSTQPFDRPVGRRPDAPPTLELPFTIDDAGPP